MHRVLQTTIAQSALKEWIKVVVVMTKMVMGRQIEQTNK
jgi:hypothetical protein